MYTTNRRKWKEFVLAYSDTRKIYNKIYLLLAFSIMFTIYIFVLNEWNINYYQKEKNDLFGEWDEIFLNLSKNDVFYFKQHAFIDDYSVQLITDTIVLNNDMKIVIGSSDNNFFKMGNIKLLSGNLPKRENEVAIEESYLSVLGVKQVGDMINIGYLSGYTICGIIEDYSFRWKMINRDVDFINCFVQPISIYDGNVNVLVKYKTNVKKDIEINYLKYRDNIFIQNNVQYHYIFLFWLIISLIIIFLFLKIRKQCNLKFKFEKEDIKFVKINQRKLWIYFVFFMSKLFWYLFLIIFINKIIFNLNYVFDYKNNLFSSIDFTNIIIKNKKIIFDSIYAENKITEIVSGRVIESFIEMTDIFLLMLLVYYFITIFLKNKIYHKITENRQYLSYYYYGNAVKIRREISMTLSIQIVIDTFFLTLFSLCLFLRNTSFNAKIVVNILIIYIINLIFLIIQAFIIFIKNRKKSKDIC